jgi:hypothetical protein
MRGAQAKVPFVMRQCGHVHRHAGCLTAGYAIELVLGHATFDNMIQVIAGGRRRGWSLRPVRNLRFRPLMAPRIMVTSGCRGADADNKHDHCRQGQTISPHIYILVGEAPVCLRWVASKRM